MKKLLLPLLIIPAVSFGNELFTQAWNFPTPDESIVASGKLQSFCVANPDKCPAGVARNAAGFGGSGGSGSLFTPATSSSANQASVTVVGDGNTVTLTTSQTSENDQVSATSDNTAEIDYHEVLNYNVE